MNKPLLYPTVAFLAAAAIGAYVYFSKTGTTAPEPSPSDAPAVSGSPRACTLEAKICPDGTAVGRTGPNCEFAPCPTPVMTVTPPRY